MKKFLYPIFSITAISLLFTGCGEGIKNSTESEVKKIIIEKKKEYGYSNLKASDILKKYGHYKDDFIVIKSGTTLKSLEPILSAHIKKKSPKKRVLFNTHGGQYTFKKDMTFESISEFTEFINFSEGLPFTVTKEDKGSMTKISFLFSSILENKLKNMKHDSLHNVISLEEIKTIAQNSSSSYDIDNYSARVLNTVSTNAFSGNAYEFISAIASANNLYFEAKDKIKIHQFQEKIYDISITPLSISSRSSSDLKKAQDDASGSESSSLLAFGYKIYEELQTSISQIVTKEGMFHLNQASGQLIVRARPSNMSLVDKVVKKFNDMYSTKINIELEILEVTLSEEHQNGIDFSIIGGTSSFTTPFKAISETLPFYTATNATETRGARVSSLVKILNTFGNVAITSKPSIQTLNSVPAVMNVAVEKDIISEISITPSTDGTQSTYDITKDVASDGMSLYLFPRVTKDGKILITIQPQTVSLLDLESKNVGGLVEIQNKTVSNREFSSTMLLENGETTLLAGFISNYKKKNKNGLPFIDKEDNYTDFIGGTRESEVKKTELVVVVTAKVVK